MPCNQVRSKIDEMSGSQKFPQNFHRKVLQTSYDYEMFVNESDHRSNVHYFSSSESKA